LSGPVHVSRAQILVGGFTNQSDTPAPLSSVPASGTFWSAQLSMPPWPFDWLPQLPVYAYGPASNQFFVIDDRDFDYPSYWTSLAAATANSGGMGAMLVSGPPPLPGSGGTNSSGGGGGTSLPMPAFSTNDLWLEIVTLTNRTNAVLVIHTPSYFTNGLYNLFYTTNLAPPISWQLIMSNVPGNRHFTVSNATDPQGFYCLGLANSSEGTDFWIAFMTTVADESAVCSLFISSQVAATGTVSNPYPGNAFSINFSVMPGVVTNIILPYWATISANNGYGLIQPFGMHITTTQPVSVYGLSYVPFGSSALTFYPTPMLGTRYSLMARPAGVPSSDWFSEFAIVATADNTTVWITPSTNANLAWYAGIVSNIITLDQGNTFQINSSTWSNDVTGTLISSDQPIAVFAGANGAYVPDANTVQGNPLVQEQLPEASWGTRVLALSFAGRTNGDSYRVLAATDSTAVTVVTANGAVTNNLEAGHFFDTNLGGWVQFNANNPIQVAQFANGASFDNTHNEEGDPLEMLLLPTGHYLTSYTIAIPDYVDELGDPFETFVNVILPQSAILATTMDGEVITNVVAITNFVQIGTSGYSGARVSVSNGSTHTITSSHPLELQVYGFGYYDAYGYIGGLNNFP
jgi:hypothetical protein